MQRVFNKLFTKRGYRLIQTNLIPADFTDEEVKIIREVSPYTLTGPERLYALINAVRFVENNNTPGAIVECGVWKGGSMMAVAKTLQHLGVENRQLYLFDTFAGMTQPTGADGVKANQKFNDTRITDTSSTWANAGLEEVKSALHRTSYDRSMIHFVKGPVEETIPDNAPEKIALLRLDTDWYESTRHELEHLYPRLSKHGIIIIDDYGHWPGSRRATDEYIAVHKLPLLLNRIDKGARLAIKID